MIFEGLVSLRPWVLCFFVFSPSVFCSVFCFFGGFYIYSYKSIIYLFVAMFWICLAFLRRGILLMNAYDVLLQEF